jgi:hypothetical protein
MKKVRSSAIPTPAMVVACIALLVSLSGTAVALPGKSQLDKNDFPVGVVRSAAIRNKGIASADLKDGIIVPSKLAVGSVYGGALQTGAVTNPKLGTGAVTNSKLGSNSVTSTKVADNAIGASEITQSGVGGSEIASNAVQADEIAANGVGSSELASNAVGSGKIAGGAVTSGELGGFTVRNDASPTNIANGGTGVSSVSCDTGEVAMGGGATWDDETTAGLAISSQRYLVSSGRPTGIEVRGFNNSGNPRTLSAQVSCLAP